jgi:hypothetical protein
MTSAPSGPVAHTNEPENEDEILIGVPVRAHRVVVERVGGFPNRVRSYDFAPRVIEIGLREERAWLEPVSDRPEIEGETYEPATNGAR